jgi:site-specific DNA-methyltransferase (adenine-specific)
MEPESFDVVFADPPYFLSNGGTTCKNGKRASVNKGKWDQSRGADENHAFNRDWLAACQRVLKPNGTIWVSGTSHVIYSVGFAMQQLGFKLLNDVIWEKPNPPPNLSCRYFTHSTETVLWAAKGPKSKHYFDYPEMRSRNGDKQMKSVWRMTAPGKREKVHGKHPTQKPLDLLDRILVASCPDGGAVLDPFNGSGTTGVAAASIGRTYTGIDLNSEYLELTQRRLLDVRPEWETSKRKAKGRAKLKIASS